MALPVTVFKELMWTYIILLQQLVSASEVLVPGAMMLVLSLIHSQIVSTHTGPTRDPVGGKSRRVKRTKRRLLFSSRSRTVYKLPDFKIANKQLMSQKLFDYHLKRRRERGCPLKRQADQFD
jgi:hypothetical protein